MISFDEAVANLEAAIEKNAAKREREKLRKRDRTLPYRTPEARRKTNLQWMARNREYERERSRLKYQWRVKGELTREEYVALKAEAFARHRQKLADEVLQSRGL